MGRLSSIKQSCTSRCFFLPSVLVPSFFNPSVLEAEAGRSLWAWNQPGLHNEFQARPAKATLWDPLWKNKKQLYKSSFEFIHKLHDSTRPYRKITTFRIWIGHCCNSFKESLRSISLMISTSRRELEGVWLTEVHCYTRQISVHRTCSQI